ncbi:hypothetical protein ACLI08_14895 [Flavobacterium sp. RNTU_13]|uniref:hypothetical protein n=1 Tax=Flavobacterium sp. RNTU_13 TaxID=3375145 RepID=UPI0039885A10
MKNYKKIGVWMDYSQAHIIEFVASGKMPEIIVSEVNTNIQKALNHNKDFILRQRLQKQHRYYKSIASAITESDEVLLFGPTDAKKELLGMLRKDHAFDEVTIELYDSLKVIDPRDYNYFSGQGVK